MRFGHIVLLALLATAPRWAGAQDVILSPDSVYSMEEITVTALRTEASPAAVSQRVTVFSAQDIDAAGAQSLADLLVRRSSLFVRQYGQGLATVSARGASPSQSLLLIDGMRLSDPQLGQFDVSLLPAYMMESVEVMHGPSSALYGSDGIAGTVNIHRYRPQADLARIGTTFGAYGERLLSGAAAITGSNWNAAVAGEVGRSEGDFLYVDETLFPPRAVRRRNADREKQSLFASIENRRGRHHLQGSLLYVSAEQGLPGLASSRPVGERQWDDHLRIWLEDGIATAAGAARVRAYVHRGSIRYLNPALAVDSRGRAITTGIEGEGRFDLGSGSRIIAGAAAAYAGADHPSLSTTARELSLAAFAGGVGVLGRLRIYPAWRVDFYDPHEGGARWSLNPRIGANLQLLSELPLHVKANAGRGFRMPTFNDRFWQPGGNPDLKPERSWSYEAALFFDGAVQLEATGFASRTADQLVWTPQTGGLWSPENLSRSETTGFEGSLRLNRRTVDAGLFYTWTRALNRSDSSSPSFGKQLRYVPRQQIKGYVALAAGPFTAGLHAGYVGRRYITGDESEWVEGAFVLDARATYARRIGPVWARLSVDVENLADSSYEVINNYPMPPRHGRVGLFLQTTSGKSK